MGDIFDIIRDKATRHEDPVPGDAWENISGQKRKRRPAGFLWLAASLLFIALGFGIYNWFANQDHKTTPKVSQGSAAESNDKEISGNSHKLTNPLPEDQHTLDNSKYPGHDQTGSTVQQDIQRTHKNEAVHYSSPISGQPNQQTVLTEKRNRQTTARVNASSDQRVAVGQSGYLLHARKKKNRKGKAQSVLAIESGEVSGTVALSATDELNKQEEISPITDISKSSISTEIPVVSTEPIQSAPENTAVNKAVIEKKTGDQKEEPVKQPVAQSTAQERKKGKRKTWSAEFSLTPMIFASDYDHNSTFRRSVFMSDSKSIFDGKLTRSHINPSVALSALLRKDINRKLNIGIGIQYLRMKELVRISGKQVNTLVVVGDVHLNPGENPEWVADTTNLVFEATGDINAINRYTFVNVPISLQYLIWNKKKWSMSLESGLTLHVSSHYTNHINRNPSAPLINTTHQSPGKTNLGFTINAGLRFGRRINNQLDFFALPFIGINPARQSIKNTIIDKNIHRAGLQMGIAWKLW